MTAAARPLVRQVPGGVRNLRPVARELVARLLVEGLDPTRADRVELAIHEVLANAFEHGHLADPSIPIDVRLVPVGSGVEVVVTDRALAGRWDAPRVGEPPDGRLADLPPAPRGRGLALAAAAVDEVVVHREASCTTVTLRLELP